MGAVVKIYTDFLEKTKISLRYYFSGVFFAGFAFTAYNVFFRIYLKNLGFNELQIGTSISLLTIGMALGAIFGAPASIKLGKKKALIAGQVLMLLCSFLMVNVPLAPVIVVGNLLFGLGYSFVQVFNHPIIFQHTERDDRITAFSFVFIISTVAGMLSSFISGNISEGLSGIWTEVSANQVTLNLFSFVLVLSIFLFSRVSFDEDLDSGAPSSNILKHSFSNYREVFQGKRVLYIIQRCFTGFGAGLIIPFFPLYIKQVLTASDGVTGNIMAITQVAMAFGGLVLPALTRKFGSMWTVIVCQMISIPFLMLIAAPQGMVLLVIALFARSMLMNMTLPAIDSMAMGLVESRLQVFMSSLMRLLNQGMRALGSFVGGYMMYKFGYSSPYPITIAAYLVSTIIFYYVFREKRE